MTTIVDANIAIAVLNPTHLLHRAAIRRCLQANQLAMLNISRAEALIHPSRQGALPEATAILDQLGIRVEIVDNGVADRARQLRADYGNRSFPMIDAVVVALGIERGWTVVTGDSKWPDVAEADVEILRAADRSEAE